jgi:hypothetical protein
LELVELPDFTLSSHAWDVLQERGIAEQWVWRTIKEADKVWEGQDGNIHFAKSIPERDDRVLHVVVNSEVNPQRVVTVFFDRRLKRNKPDETQD